MVTYKILLPVFILFLFSQLTFASGIEKNVSADSTGLEFLYERAKKIQEHAEEFKNKAQEVKTEYLGYKLKAKFCKNAAQKEAGDGYSLADKAIKEATKAGKEGAKAEKAKSANKIMKSINKADENMKKARYYLHMAEERRKEILFELKGC